MRWIVTHSVLLGWGVAGVGAVGIVVTLVWRGVAGVLYRRREQRKRLLQGPYR